MKHSFLTVEKKTENHFWLSIFFLLFISSGVYAQIVSIENDQVQEDSTGLQLALQIDFYTTKNTNTIYSSNAGSYLQYNTGKHRIISMNEYSLILNDNNKEESGENRAYQHLRYNYLWRKKLIWEAFTQIQFDQLLRIQKRILLGVGPRFNIMKAEKSDLHFGIAYMYEYEQERGNNIFHRSHRMSSFLSINKVFENRHSVSAISYYQPRFNDLLDFRLSLGTQLALKIVDNLSFNFNVNLSYDAKPVIDEEIESLTYNIRNGLNISF